MQLWWEPALASRYCYLTPLKPLLISIATDDRSGYRNCRWRNSRKRLRSFSAPGSLPSPVYQTANPPAHSPFCLFRRLAIGTACLYFSSQLYCGAARVTSPARLFPPHNNQCLSLAIWVLHRSWHTHKVMSSSRVIALVIEEAIPRKILGATLMMH